MKYLVTAVAGILMAGAAQAATVTSSFTNPLQTTEISQSGSLALFNSQLGTLTSMSLSLNGMLSTTLTLTNNAAQAQNINATSNTDLSFTSSLGALNALLVNPAISLSVSTGMLTLGQGGTTTIGPLSNSGSATLNAAQLAGIMSNFAVNGGGTFSVDCSSLSGYSVSGGGNNIRSQQTTQAGCGAQVTYVYEERKQEVPEPGALALAGLALAALGLSRKAAKARKA